MKRTLLIIVLAVASFGVFASSASAGIDVPGPQQPDQYFCFGLGAGTIKCYDFGDPAGIYSCSYSGGYQCAPAGSGATAAGARDLAESLAKAGTGPATPGLSGASPSAPAQGTAGGSGAPIVAGAGRADGACAASMDIEVPRDAALTRTLHVDFADGQSGNYPIYPGSGNYTLTLTHYYFGQAWNADIIYPPDTTVSSNDFEVTAVVLETGAWDATAWRHVTVPPGTPGM